MKNIQPLNINAYAYNELNSEAKDKAMSDQIGFWMEAREYNDNNKGNFEKAIDEAEDMQTPWFTGSYIYDYCKDEILEEIEDGEYLYDQKGELLPITLVATNKLAATNKYTFNITKNQTVEITIV